MPFKRKKVYKMTPALAKRMWPSKRKPKQSRQVMINRMPRIAKSLIAPKYFTTVEASFQGLTAINGLASNVFLVSASNVVRPFNFSTNSLSFTNMTSSTFQNSGAETVLTLSSAGMDPLSVLYDRYRVHASQLNVTVTPLSSNDTMEIVVLPINYDSTASGFILPTSYYAAKSQPYSKSKQVTGNNNIKQNTLISKLKNRTILGLSKQQYRGDLDNACDTGEADASITLGAPNNPVAWYIAYSKYANAVVGANVCWSVTIKYFIELFSPKQNQTV